MLVCQSPRALSEQMVANVNIHQTWELYEIGTHIFIYLYGSIETCKYIYIYISHIEVEDACLYVSSIIILTCIVIAQILKLYLQFLLTKTSKYIICL